MKFKSIGLLSVLLGICLLSGCRAETPSSAGDSGVKTASGAPVEANWTLHVDQTIPVEKDGMTVNYTLVIVADKHGGTDIHGIYSGNAQLEVEMDASKLSNEVIKMVGGFKVEASSKELEFELIPHDPETFAGYYHYGEGEIPMLTPLRDYTGMALVSPEMTGAGILNPQAEGIGGEKVEVNESASGTEAIPMRILVNDMQVQVDVPTLKIGKIFEGQLLGEPVK